MTPTEIKLLTDPVDYELYEDTGDHGEEVRYANFEHEQILNTFSLNAIISIYETGEMDGDGWNNPREYLPGARQVTVSLITVNNEDGEIELTDEQYEKISIKLEKSYE